MEEGLYTRENQRTRWVTPGSKWRRDLTVKVPKTRKFNLLNIGGKVVAVPEVCVRRVDEEPGKRRRSQRRWRSPRSPESEKTRRRRRKSRTSRNQKKSGRTLDPPFFLVNSDLSRLRHVGKDSRIPSPELVVEVINTRRIPRCFVLFRPFEVT